MVIYWYYSSQVIIHTKMRQSFCRIFLFGDLILQSSSFSATLSHLQSTLPSLFISVDSKELAGKLSPVFSTLKENTGVGDGGPNESNSSTIDSRY